LNRQRPLAYTTVLTLLDRLGRKGLAGRSKRGRAHVYHPLISRDEVMELALERLTRDFFDGSRERLSAHLLGQPVAGQEIQATERDEALDAALL